jgi:hypothetical protein
MFHIPKPVYEIPEQGVQLARIIRIIDLGSHDWKGQHSKGPERTFKIYAELPTCKYTLANKGKPMIVKRQFKASLHAKANLRLFVEGYLGKDLAEDVVESWFGDNFWKFVGLEGQANIKHSEDGQYANLTTFTKIPADPATKKPLFAVPAATYKLILFTLDKATWDPSPTEVKAFTGSVAKCYAKFGSMKAMLENLPEQDKEFVMNSPEYTELVHGPSKGEPSQSEPSGFDGNEDPPVEEDGL